MKYIEYILFKLVIWRLRKGWGADCFDLDPYWHTEGGCGSCRAKKCIEFLEKHLELS